MTSPRNRILAFTAFLALVLGGASTAQAGGADPQQGYLSVHDNLVNKGVNHGRCMAVAVLGERILLSGYELPALVPGEIADECAGHDVFLSEDIVEEILDSGE